jgi:sulfite reductase (NADPH) flavoprotein alpha-component
MSESATIAASGAGKIFNRHNPFVAEIVRHYPLTFKGSSKDTRHFVISLGDSGITYLPGDSLATFGRNPPYLVDQILELTGFSPDTIVTDAQGGRRSLHDVLLKDFTINRSNRKVLTGLLQRVASSEEKERLTALLNSEDALREYVETRDYVDLLKEHPSARFETPEAFLAQLSPNAPRLYSIAGALAAHPGEVHLCVAVVRYETHGRARKGLASGFLADHAETFARTVPIYIQEARTFRLPADHSRDIIMVGPGTGIAPFRAFVEQRVADRAPGRNWLFFGEERRARDFLYGDEWLDYKRKGVLTHLDLAFSRDQEQKVYVQHRMLEKASDLWAWLQGGAYFYVCGDARKMARDVHQTLIQIAHEQGGLTAETARDYVETTLMKTEKRYLRDVY